MHKTIINPETGDWAGHEVAYSDAVTIDYPTHTRIFISGMISDSASIKDQTRDVLSQIEHAIGTVLEEGEDIGHVTDGVMDEMLSAAKEATKAGE